ncbi:MAG: hypothetical protein ACYS14_09425 [Planctomycetota bacterium]|jgi:hypothetical protein
MDKIALQTLIVFVSCGMAFGVGSEISWVSGDTRPDLSRLPDNPTTNDIISFVIPTDVFSNRWRAEQQLGGTPTLIIDPVEKRIDLRFEPPVQPDPTPTKYDPVSGLQGHFGPLEEGSWLFFVQFQGTIYIDPFYVGPGEPQAKDHLTEHFESSQDTFDLMYSSILFSPTLDGTSYTAAIRQITHLPTDPAGGIDLELGDDDFKRVKLAGSQTVSIYRSSFTRLFVGSNGYITFTEGDRQHSETLANHFSLLRVSALFGDLNPSAGGQVSWRQLSDHVAVTWQNIPEYGTNNSNTFQIALFYDGSIQVSWQGIDALQGIVGLSEGLGIPPDFQETDFSEISAPPPTSDHLVEEFTSGADAFDLFHKSIMFSPTAAGTSYSAKVQDILHLPTNPSGGMNLSLGDDDFTFIKLPSPSMVSIYGSSFAGFYVGSNGYLTFTEGDEDYSESLEDHFDTLRVSALFRDLNPSGGGQIVLKTLNNRTSVTWLDVPGYDGSGPNTFQIELFFDGRIRLSWLGMASESGIVGLSDGGGLPPDLRETDFSELAAPPPPPVKDHLTEEFSSGDDRFDLQYASVTFTPTWDRTSYIGSLQDITRLPTDPVGGTNLGLRDDNSVLVRLRNQARVRIFDQSFPTFFVGANGYVTFTGIDQDFSQSLAEHFEMLRISGLYTDLTAANEGRATAKQMSNRVAVTWEAVPEFSNTSPNTFQIEMFFDGRIRLSWLDIGSRRNIVGLSNGLDMPADFEETDFSIRYAEP